MATKIEDIYSAIGTIVSTTLTGYDRLPNPFIPEANSYLLLGEKSYGIVAGPGTDTQLYVGCLVSWQRTFYVTLFHQVTTTENNDTDRQSIDKALLVDHDAIIRAFYNNNTLGGVASKSIIQGDSGINFVDGDRLKFLAIELTLLVDYQESPT